MDYESLSKTLPLSKETEILKTPVKVGTGIVPNRLAIQAMEGADGTNDGSPDELTLRRYDRFAKSGAGLLWFEATAVSPEGRANPRQLWLHKDNLDAFKRIVADMKETAVKEHGTLPVIIMQATHSGRYSKPEGKPEPLIACNNPIYEGDTPLPPERIITDGELRRIEEAYDLTTCLAMAAGFDGIDIKACHRYLNSELLSAVTRPGEYGGSLENRMRFYKNCVERARNVAGKDFIVTSRMNIYDGIPYPYGFGVNEHDSVAPDLSEPIEVIKRMGFSLLNITIGNPYFNPNVNRPVDLAGVERMYALTKQVRDACPGLVIVSSAPTYLREFSLNLAAGAVEQSYADIVGFGRMSFAYPNFARDMLNGEFDKKQVCVTCGKCSELMRRARAGCVVRDSLYTEMYKALPPL
jgi:2,4-dienoyl-CoA reductase-like NADH-dependent reductase (Old Yellow Enzyme family)